MDGVQVASADITIPLNREQSASFSLPDMIGGSDLRGRDLESFKVHYAEGRELQPDDAGKAVIGSDMVRKLNAHLGDTISVRDHEFQVVGIIDKTFTIPDHEDLHDDRLWRCADIAHGRRPFGHQRDDHVGLRADARDRHPQGPGCFERQDHTQFLGESALIGAIGGLTGLLFGWLFVLAANAAGQASGTEIFLLTSRLAVGSVAFAVVLGVLSGLYPSWHAARMNPVKALRYE